MEAKDTVMDEESLEEVKYLELKDNPEYRFELPTRVARKVQDKAIATRQAEISFKAGIREIVGWIKVNLPDEYGSISEWSVWQAQLKEWKIKE